ncbi:MAG: ROK family protein [Acidimicrobiia bacterium]|nr:ROK family protein [Acidimicrobiia bacterium]
MTIVDTEQFTITDSQARNLLAPNCAAIGVDVGGTEIKGIVANALATFGTTRRRTSRLQIGDNSQIANSVVEVASALKARAAEANVTVNAIGIGIPGSVDSQNGIGTSSANLGWQDFPIGQIVAERLAMAVYVEHDIYLGALAEFTVGSARHDSSSAFVPLGTGTGCTLMFDRRVWRGTRNFAGEIGHINDHSLTIKCNCGRTGCAELLASATGLERIYAAKFGADITTTAEEIAGLAERGDTTAQTAWGECVDRIASMLAALVLTTDIESIVVGGGLSNARAALYDSLQAALAQKLHPLRKPPKLQLCTFGSEAGARGAALHALSQHTHGTHQRRTTSSPSVQPALPSCQPRPAIAMLAFDHRASAAKQLFGKARLSPLESSRLAEAKVLIAKGAVAAVAHIGAESEVSILVDPEYGLGALDTVHQAGIPAALALERSGLRELSLLDGELLTTALDRVASIRWGKVLVRYNPRDSENRKSANLRALESARNLCDAKGMEFLLELIVPATSTDLEVTGGSKDAYERELLRYRLPEAVYELTRHLGAPHLWKIQGVESPPTCLAVAEAATVDGATPRIVVLGAAADRSQINRWFSSSAGAPGYCGFAIGRSIWQEPIRNLLSGNTSAEQTTKLIASTLLQNVDDFLIATRVHPLDATK